MSQCSFSAWQQVTPIPVSQSQSSWVMAPTWSSARAGYKPSNLQTTNLVPVSNILFHCQCLKQILCVLDMQLRMSVHRIKTRTGSAYTLLNGMDLLSLQSLVAKSHCIWLTFWKVLYDSSPAVCGKSARLPLFFLFYYIIWRIWLGKVYCMFSNCVILLIIPAKVHYSCRIIPKMILRFNIWIY